MLAPNGMRRGMSLRQAGALVNLREGALPNAKVQNLPGDRSAGFREGYSNEHGFMYVRDKAPRSAFASRRLASTPHLST